MTEAVVYAVTVVVGVAAFGAMGWIFGQIRRMRDQDREDE